MTLQRTKTITQEKKKIKWKRKIIKTMTLEKIDITVELSDEVEESENGS